MFIINHKKIFVTISAVLVSLSIIVLIIFGLRLGIDFKGGSLLEINFTNQKPSQQVIQKELSSLKLGDIVLQPVGNTGYSIKSRNITDTERASILKTLGSDATQTSFTAIGPSVGAELVRKSIISFILVVLGIILWIAYSFRKASRPVSSWKYGIIAILALIHDVTIPVGIFTVISHFMGVDVNTLFVVAILTILGLSVSDTIVVFDRIRENIRIGHFKSFEETVGQSINQVYVRSLATSSTVMIVLLALIFFGPTSTKIFAIMLAAGMFFGTYSSLFLASPILVMVKNHQDRKKLKAKK